MNGKSVTQNAVCALCIVFLSACHSLAGGAFDEARTLPIAGQVSDAETDVTVELKATSMETGAKCVYKTTAVNGQFLQNVKLFPGQNLVTAKTASGSQERIRPFSVRKPTLRVHLDCSDIYYHLVVNDWADGDDLNETFYRREAEAGLYRISVYHMVEGEGDPVVAETTVSIYINDILVSRTSNGDGKLLWSVGTVVLHSGDQVGGYSVEGNRLDIAGQGDLKGFSPQSGGYYQVTALVGPNNDGPVFLAAGNAAQFSAAGTLYQYGFGANQNVDVIESFTSAEETVGSIDALGVFVAKAPGHTQVSCEGYAGDPIDVYVVKVDINGDYNRDGAPVDHAAEASAVTFEGPKGMVILANNDDDNSNDLPDAIEDDVINGAEDLEDITTFKVACLGIQAEEIPSTFTVEIKALDPLTGELSDAVRVFPQLTENQSGGAQLTFPNSLVKATLAGTSNVTMGIEGIVYGKEAVVRMTLKNGGNALCTDEFRVRTSPYFVSPNNHMADEVFVSFTSNPYVLNAFASGLSGICPLRKSSDYPAGAGSNPMCYIQDHAEFGYTQTPVGLGTFKAMRVILGKAQTDPNLQDLLENDRAFFTERLDQNFGNLIVTPETIASPYGTIICGSGFSYLDFLKKQNVQPAGGGVVAIDAGWLATPHIDNLVAIIPSGASTFAVFVADLQLAIDLLNANPTNEIEVFEDPRPIYNDLANSDGIQAIKAKLEIMYDALETGLGISKSQFIHVPVAFDPMMLMGDVRTFLPVSVNMQYVQTSNGKRVFVPEACFEPFFADAIGGLRAKLNGIGIDNGEIVVVPTGSGMLNGTPFNFGMGGDVHCISNPSMQAPTSP